MALASRSIDSISCLESDELTTVRQSRMLDLRSKETCWACLVRKVAGMCSASGGAGACFMNSATGSTSWMTAFFES